MKRSEVNNIITEIESLLIESKFYLPIWAYWTPKEWMNNIEAIQLIKETGLGWDITDFGSGNFAKRGLSLFTIRNGKPKGKYKNYAEKILVIQEEQETPFHKHLFKKEDIINRNGGVLVIQLYNSIAGENELCRNSAIEVYIDSIPQRVEPGGEIELHPGQSIMLDNHHYHRFYAKKGCGVVLAGEVSMVNDDESDNYFIDPNVGRFSPIKEDSEPYRLLVGDYEGLTLTP